uniref:Glucan endo-1,3-beta-glucosidase 8-like isoform X3 n=2 Tax=Nicotiana TaxID=4085 RepID=A0A1S4BU88_TOBAC|nr:PREDICTED: glucan endo-1,3-beta-glucosidase 8-like isoform X3 [Nicotiana sylvestris]XP_016492388.1 PREDICTED: glucan endo-1,3-beta-glucosidase 8-like isoform X3 [Nicotiana tabacum]
MYKNTGSLWKSLFMSLMFLSLGGIQVDAFVGINWGRMAKQRFVPSMVVDLLLQNGITELRIFQPSLNVLDAFADTNIGYGDMEIVIGQIGWPTDGYEGASEENAERFHRGFLKYLGRKEGTPLRPNKDINVFLLSLTDENMVNTDIGNYQRHWGIYKLDGEPKYKIDFTMHDLNTKPTVAKGTVKMPNRWCVFDGKTEYNETLLMKDFDSACMDSDCSTFGSGATCDHLVFAEKVSYAYNMRYQMNNQDQEYCELLGAELTANNPSTPDCEFPVEILTAEVVDGGSPDTKKY